MSVEWVTQDGIKDFEKAFEPELFARALASVCRWPSPEAFKLLPVWFPHTARKQPLFTKRWAAQMKNQNEPKFQGNEEANRTLTQLVTKSAKDRPNWTCCHIWGNDSATGQTGQPAVKDLRYYSCPANMVLVPTPLKGLTDSVPEVKNALRIASHRLYGFVPEGQTCPSTQEAGPWLPDGWADGTVSGIVSMNSVIEARVRRRAKKLIKDFNEAPNQYPTQQVQDTIAYWKEHAPGSLLDQTGAV